MKNHWLAVTRDNSFLVAKIAASKNNELKIKFLSQYTYSGAESDMPGHISQHDIAGLKTWLRGHRIPIKKLKLAISGFGLITRVINLPQMSTQDLESILTNHIDQYFTLNVKNYIIDYRILKKYKENEKQMISVLLAAYPKIKMENIWLLSKSLGFEPAVIDLTADCLARLYSRLVESEKRDSNSKDFEQALSAGDIAVVSLQANKIEFILLENGIFFLYSDLEFNTQELFEHYQANSNELDTPAEKQRDSEKNPQEDGEITLNLSSYINEDNEAIQPQPVSVYNESQTEDEEEHLNEESLDSDKESLEFRERERFLNELIGLDEERTYQETDNLIPIEDESGENTAEYDKSHISENTEEQGKHIEEGSEEGLEEGLEEPDEEDILYFPDDNIFELTKSLPQLDFSLNRLGRNADNKIVDYLESDAEEVPNQTSLSVDKPREDSVSADEPEQELTVLNRDQDKPAENREESDEAEVFKQSALSINRPKADNDFEFVLEDLFVPVEELDEELVVTQTMQELGQGIMSNSQTAEKTEASLPDSDATAEVSMVSNDGNVDPIDNAKLDMTLVNFEKTKVSVTDRKSKEDLESTFEPVLSNLTELLSFFAARHFGHTINKVYLTGDYCTLPFIKEIFQDNLGIETIVGFPNDWKPHFIGKSKALEVQWQKYGDLYGLALRED